MNSRNISWKGKKAEFVSLRLEHQKEAHFFKRRICVNDSGWHIEMDQLDAIGMNQCKSMATPESKDQERQATNDKLDAQEHSESSGQVLESVST